LIDPGDPDDADRTTFIPSAEEWWPSRARIADPIGDNGIRRCRHRASLPDRVLSSWSMSCAVYCRFCFRREMVGRARRPRYRLTLTTARSTTSARTTRSGKSSSTGGDPLIFAATARRNMADLAAIDHVRSSGIHTRYRWPSRAHQREMVAALRVEGAATWVALHPNHARELTGRRARRAPAMIDAGFRWSASRCCCVRQ